MKSLALAAGALLAVAATTADAQYYRDSPNWRGMGGYECWNPRAGHFEGVREGERQDDLDFGRCRRTDVRNYSYNYDDRRYYNDDRYRYREPVAGYECWNPSARHYEAVRQGEIQDDLDFSRCRNGSYAYRYR